METIVLAHGYLGFVRIGAVEYFNGVASHLKRECRVEVVTPQVEPVGTVAERSASLLKQISAASPKRRVHIIAHSAGGLDARHLVSPQGRNRSDLAASVTTISTPNRGSVVADAALGLIREFTDVEVADLIGKLSIRNTGQLRSLLERLVGGLKDRTDVLLQELGLRRTDPPEAVIGKLKTSIKEAGQYLRSLFMFKEAGLRDLTTEAVSQQFNPIFKDSPEVSYFSYAGVSGPGEQDILPPLLYLPYVIVLSREGRNDGLVSVASAKWGEFKGEIPADHAEEIGHDLSQLSRLRRFITRRGFDHLKFYASIVNQLTKHIAN